MTHGAATRSAIEGSDDGQTWKPFLASATRPGDTSRKGPGSSPRTSRGSTGRCGSPRSDTYRDNPWFVQFLVRLLEGSTEVTGLLHTNPFPKTPPRYIRAVLYDYHFTRFGDSQPGWWKRELRGTTQPLSLENFPSPYSATMRRDDAGLGFINTETRRRRGFNRACPGVTNVWKCSVRIAKHFSAGSMSGNRPKSSRDGRMVSFFVPPDLRFPRTRFSQR